MALADMFDMYFMILLLVKVQIMVSLSQDNPD